MWIYIYYQTEQIGLLPSGAQIIEEYSIPFVAPLHWKKVIFGILDDLIDRKEWVGCD